MTQGVAVAAMVREGLWERVLGQAIGYVTLGTLNAVVLLRYGSSVDWDAPLAWLYPAFVGVVLATGAYAWRASELARRREQLLVVGGNARRTTAVAS